MCSITPFARQRGWREAARGFGRGIALSGSRSRPSSFTVRAIPRRSACDPFDRQRGSLVSLITPFARQTGSPRPSRRASTRRFPGPSSDRFAPSGHPRRFRSRLCVRALPDRPARDAAAVFPPDLLPQFANLVVGRVVPGGFPDLLFGIVDSDVDPGSAIVIPPTPDCSAIKRVKTFQRALPNGSLQPSPVMRR